MIRKYHTLQTNPQSRKEEPQNTKGHKTYMEGYMHYTDQHNKTAAFWVMNMDILEVYILFNRSCTINGSKPRLWGGGMLAFVLLSCQPRVTVT